MKLSKLDYLKNCELNIPSNRTFSGLSDGEGIIEIGRTEQKIWLFKDTSNISDIRS